MAARSVNDAVPSRSVSPACTRRRSITSGSTATPRSASVFAIGPGGSSVTAPISGQAGSTAFSSTSMRSPEAVTSIERMVTTSDTRAPRAMSHWRSVSGQRLGAALDFQVTAENAAAVLGEAAGDAFAQRSDGGDGGDAEGEAGEHDAQAGDATAEFAAGEAEGEGQQGKRLRRQGEAQVNVRADRRSSVSRVPAAMLAIMLHPPVRRSARSARTAPPVRDRG